MKPLPINKHLMYRKTTDKVYILQNLKTHLNTIHWHSHNNKMIQTSIRIPTSPWKQPETVYLSGFALVSCIWNQRKLSKSTHRSTNVVDSYTFARSTAPISISTAARAVGVTDNTRCSSSNVRRMQGNSRQRKSLRPLHNIFSLPPRRRARRLGEELHRRRSW